MAQFYQPNQNPLPHKNISKTKESQSQIYYIINKQKKHTNTFLFIKHIYNFKQNHSSHITVYSILLYFSKSICRETMNTKLSIVLLHKKRLNNY